MKKYSLKKIFFIIVLIIVLIGFFALVSNLICSGINMLLKEEFEMLFYILVPLFVMLVCFIAGFYITFVSRYITNRRKKRCSLVIYAKYEKYRNDGGLYTPIYVYNYNGKNYKYYDESEEISSKNDLPKEDKQIMLYINPNKPKETYIDGENNYYDNIKVFGILLMILSAFFSICFYFTIF